MVDTIPLTIDGFDNLSYIVLLWLVVSGLALALFTPQIIRAFQVYRFQVLNNGTYKTERLIALGRLLDLVAAYVTTFCCFTGALAAGHRVGTLVVLLLTLIPINKLVHTQVSNQVHKMILESLNSTEEKPSGNLQSSI